MKILHVEGGRHLYGGARQVAYLLNGLRDYPAEHILVCHRSSPLPQAIDNPKVRIFPCPVGGDADLVFAFQLYRWIRHEKPDILHLHSRRGELPAMLAGVASQVPMIVTRRVDNPENPWLAKLKYRHFRRVIAISQGIAEVLIKQGLPEEKLSLVHSGVDTQIFRPPRKESMRGQLGIPPDHIVIAVVAQLIPRKGHLVLFESLSRLRRDYPELKLTSLVFGKGPLEAELKAHCQKLGLQNQVRWMGYREDMAEILPAMDVVVHPALKEGLGVALLEAAACGLPIIASRSGGMPEVVEDGVNGLLVPPGDPNALGCAINHLARDSMLRSKMGEAGRQKVLRQFSIASMVEGNWQVYKR
ncbi:MAG: hypothetical protein AXA67_12230 [Methylothermaceae bacteria B42]|nr:MAG: hypothetical protein AXA67_12230 [Methylothermaceae bacteria B42]HHJ39298.1 glycosyltransferase family 1 protein [Methylothermaceae bacterium]